MSQIYKEAHVVIVDDNPINVAMLQMLLEDNGYRNTVGVTDPRQLLGLIQQQPADLLLLDFRMPYLNGQQVVELLQKEMENLPGIIVLTAETDRDTRQALLSLGVDDFLVKPFDHDEVLQRIHNTLELHTQLQTERHQSHSLAALVDDRTAQLERLSRQDPVTELPNRRALLEELEYRSLSSGQMTVFYLALDGIAEFSALHGYQAADQLLRQVAERLLKLIPRSNKLAVWNSTEWIVTYPRRSEPQQLAAFAQRLVETVEEPLDYDGGKYNVQLRVGACSSDQSLPSEQLIRRAALATPLSASCFRVFDQSLEDELARQQRLRHALRHAVTNQELELYYQPKLCLQSGRMIGAEALLRWNSAEFGPVSPAEFIPIAEASGDIVAIGEWVLEQGLERRLKWQQQQHIGEDWVLAINVAAAQLSDSEFGKRLIQRVKEQGLSPRVLEIEVTESGLMQDMGLAMAQLRMLNRAGIRVAIDDFGTGYSSLAYLKQLPVSVLKIDIAFIRELHTSEQDRRMTQAVIDMAKNFRCATVAEGIEEPAQLALLQSMGCDRGQGYLFAPPLNEAGLLDLCSIDTPFDHLFKPV